MIDRSYLPFRSARLYQDRKMAKWMGFFLSEHTSALEDDAIPIPTHSQLSLEEKYLLLGQLQLYSLKAHISILENKQLLHYTGTLENLTATECLLKLCNGYQRIFIETIVSIQQVEEEQDEPTRLLS